MSLVISKRPDGSVIISCGAERVRVSEGVGVERLRPRTSRPVHASGTITIQMMTVHVDRLPKNEADLDDLDSRLIEVQRNFGPAVSERTVTFPVEILRDTKQLQHLISAIVSDLTLDLPFIDPDE